MAEDTVCFEDVINILVATDIHLGYAERDPERGKHCNINNGRSDSANLTTNYISLLLFFILGQDSFNAFEEILQLASSSKVDFILLGGDLFHDSKPSPTCLHKCITLLKK